MRRMRSACWARAMNGHVAAPPRKRDEFAPSHSATPRQAIVPAQRTCLKGVSRTYVRFRVKSVHFLLHQPDVHFVPQ